MEWIIWTGAAITVLGCIGLGLSVVMIARARKQAADDDALRARLASVIPVNLGSLGIAVIGLMTVVVGLALS